MLLRYRRIDRAFCLAEKINVKDLFMDLHFAALECNEKTLAQKAQELASNLLVSSSLIGKVLQNSDVQSAALMHIYVCLLCTYECEYIIIHLSKDAILEILLIDEVSKMPGHT
eukprot:Em0041g14a